MSSAISRLLSVIESPDFGADDVVDAQALYPILKESAGTDLETVCCNLFHFTTDTDIRMEDRKYRRFQENELNRLIKLLKVHDLDSAKEISFLSDTGK